MSSKDGGGSGGGGTEVLVAFVHLVHVLEKPWMVGEQDHLDDGYRERGYKRRVRALEDTGEGASEICEMVCQEDVIT